MKKVLLLGFIALFLFSCSNEELIQDSTIQKASFSKDNPCGEAKVVDLIAGQHIDIGSVTISNDEDYLYITYQTEGDWYIDETHVYVGPDEDIPLNNQGNPHFGHFPYNDDHNPAVQSYTVEIPLDGLDECFSVVTHAAVTKVVNGEIVQGETAFGCGDKEFPGKRWGCYTDYCVQECEEEEKCIDVFAYKKSNPEHSHCFTDDGFSTLGWTNNFTHYWLNNINYQFPIYKDISDCDPTDDATEIGYINIITFFDGEDPKGTVTYNITDPNYSLNEVNLYVGLDKYPNDGTNPSINPADYTYHATDLDNKVYSFTFDWPGVLNGSSFDTYIIPHAKVCEVED